MTTSKTEKTAETVKTAAKPAEKSRLVYMGPSIAKIHARNRLVYVGELPDAIKNTITEHPYFGNLFVHLEDVMDAAKQLKTGAGAVAEAYRLAVKELM